MVRDLTQGSPLKVIVNFSMPIFVGMLFQVLYTLVDSIVVSRFLGVGALGAIGSTGSLTNFTNGFTIGMMNGFAVITAQLFGAGDYSAMRKSVSSAVWLTAIIGLVLSLAMALNVNTILTLMSTPADIFDAAKGYIVMLFWGLFITGLYNLSLGVLRALGDSRTPLLYMILSQILNIVFDLIFVLLFKMGTYGVGLATIFSQLCCTALIVYTMYKHVPILHMSKGEILPDKKLMGRLCGVGIPMGLQISITGIGALVLQRAVNALGSAAVTATTVASKVNMLLILPFESVGTAMPSYAGQNLGAGRIDRIKKGVADILIAQLILCMPIYLIALFLGEKLTLLFAPDTTAEVLNMAGLYLKINGALYLLLSFVNTIRNTLQGMGYSVPAMTAGVLEMCGRSIVGLVMIPLIGFAGSCHGHGFAWLFADCFLIPMYFIAMRKFKKQGLQQKAAQA
ncbi:MAG: MATE family efflux transporter [Clostridiales bacterium]|nr:MATE family efflux transporter [Clostridiales bacterium]